MAEEKQESNSEVLDKLTKSQRLEVYKKLLNVMDPEQLDKTAFAEQIGISTQALGGMIGQLKTNPKMRRELEDLGYTPKQLPGWVASLPSTPSAETPLPAGSPRASGATKITKGVSQVSNQLREESSNQLSNQSTPTTSTPPPGPMEGQDGRTNLPVGAYNRLAWRARSRVQLFTHILLM